MKIVHVTGYFVAGMAYQENLLPMGQAELGNKVCVLTGLNEPDFGFNTTTRSKQLGKFKSGGVDIIRLPHYFEFRNRGPILKGLFSKISELQPDILFVHYFGFSFVICLIYKIIYPSVKLQVDCHSTESNSRRSKIGPFYHFICKLICQCFKHKIDRFFSVAPETTEFMIRYYGLSSSEIKLLPLPGDSSIVEKSANRRREIRSRYNLTDDQIVLIHTGKLPGEKKTDVVLSMFKTLEGNNYRLLIVGAIDEKYLDEFNHCISHDLRIRYLGWMNSEELREIIFISDLLIQPGSVSNTFIDAVCCGVPVILDDTPQGRYLTQWGNGAVVDGTSILTLTKEIVDCLSPARFKKIKECAIKAHKKLDYKEIAAISLCD